MIDDNAYVPWRPGKMIKMNVGHRHAVMNDTDEDHLNTLQVPRLKAVAKQHQSIAEDIRKQAKAEATKVEKSC